MNFDTPAEALADAARKLSPGHVARVLRLPAGNYTWAIVEIAEHPHTWPMAWAGAEVVPGLLARSRTIGLDHTAGTLVLYTDDPTPDLIDEIRAALGNEPATPDRPPRWVLLAGDLRPVLHEQLVAVVGRMLSGRYSAERDDLAREIVDVVFAEIVARASDGDR